MVGYSNLSASGIALMTEAQALRRRIRSGLGAFIVGLAVSGLTAIPLNWELGVLTRLVGSHFGGLSDWIFRVEDGLRETDARYPFIAYGTDWLAFGHLMIAVAFIGPYLDPVRNRWTSPSASSPASASSPGRLSSAPCAAFRSSGA